MDEYYPKRQGNELRFIPGQILGGRYQIIELRGRGAFGELYKANDLFLKKPVALKLLREEWEDDVDMTSRFLGEVGLGQAVTHQNVCRIHDLGESDGHFYVSMEYIAGENLEELLEKAERLFKKRAREIAQEICQGLIAIHSKEILHRDLKPANVMIDKKGKAKITDFGFAIEAKMALVNRTSGTPLYSAPELFSGERGPTVQSDIYSLGAVLYEMFTGQSVDKAKSTRNLGPDQPPVPRFEMRNVNPKIERIILKCLENDPDKRPENAKEILIALTGEEEPHLEESNLSADNLRARPGDWRPERDQPLPYHSNWVLKEQLHETGLGSVWRADHKETGDHKVYKFAFTNQALDSFKRQIREFLSLKQELGDRDDIRRFEDWNIDGEDPHYIEAEYLSEGNLIEWADKRDGGLQQVELSTRLDIIAQVASTLADAHSVGVVHENLGPQHVFLSVGESGQLRTHLGGFGLGSEAADIEWFRTFGGAPELDPDKPAHTPESNIYALGIMLYQIVKGEFKGRPDGEWHRYVNDVLLQDIITKATDQSSTRRFGSASDLAEKLRNLEKERQVLEAERLVLDAQKRRKSANRRLSIAVVVLLVMAIFIFAFRNQRNIADQLAERAEREAESAQQMFDLLVNLNKISETFDVPSDGTPITTHDILARGAGRLISQLEEQPLHQARLMRTIGDVYTRLSYYEDAEALLDRALSIQRDNPDDRDSELFAKTLHSLARVYLSLEEYQKGDPLLEEALEIRNSIGNRQEIALLLNDLAWSRHSRGHYEEAEQLYRQALYIRKDLFGDDHIDVADSMSNLAITETSIGKINGDVGKMEEAEGLLRKSLAIRRELLPEYHELVAIGEYQLAWNLYYQKKFDEARSSLQTALNTGYISLGERHHYLGNFETLDARLKIAEGEYGEAERSIRSALEVLAENLPEGSWQIASSKGILGECLAGLKRYDDAEALLVDSYEKVEDATGPTTLYTREAKQRLVDFYESWGKPEEAERIRQS